MPILFICLKYHIFNILDRSVDTFEHKLEEAQKALGIASKDFIPVIYTQV
jgi:hypothetical protein